MDIKREGIVASALGDIDTFLYEKGLTNPSQSIYPNAKETAALNQTDRVQSLFYLLLRHYVTHSYQESPEEKIQAVEHFQTQYSEFLDAYAAAYQVAQKNSIFLTYLRSKSLPLDKPTAFDLDFLARANEELELHTVSTKVDFKGLKAEQAYCKEVKEEKLKGENLTRAIQDSNIYKNPPRYKVILYTLQETIDKRPHELRN